VCCEKWWQRVVNHTSESDLENELNYLDETKRSFSKCSKVNISEILKNVET
jgi:hypothetical protein